MSGIILPFKPSLMKRRNFVQNAAVGIVGLNAGTTDLHFLQDSPLRKVFDKFVKITGLTPCLSSFFLDAQLVAVSNSFKMKHALKGYSFRKCDRYFYGAHNTFCIYAYERYHDATGLCDMIVPFFKKDNDGQWSHFYTANGFQIVALTKLADQCTVEHFHPGAALLPVSRGTGSEITFKSQLADVSIHTKTFSERADTIAFFKSTVVKHQVAFTSACLTCS